MYVLKSVISKYITKTLSFKRILAFDMKAQRREALAPIKDINASPVVISNARSAAGAWCTLRINMCRDLPKSLKKVHSSLCK